MFGRDTGAEEISTEKLAEMLSDEGGYEKLVKAINSLAFQGSEFYFDVLEADSSNIDSVKIHVAKTTNAIGRLPGDLEIKSYKDPENGDLVKVGGRQQGSLFDVYGEVVDLSIKQSYATIKQCIDPRHKVEVRLSNILHVIDEIVEFRSERWKSIVEMFDMDISEEWILRNVERDIEAWENDDLQNKEEILDKLNERKSILED